MRDFVPEKIEREIAAVFVSIRLKMIVARVKKLQYEIFDSSFSCFEYI